MFVIGKYLADWEDLWFQRKNNDFMERQDFIRRHGFVIYSSAV